MPVPTSVLEPMPAAIKDRPVKTAKKHHVKVQELDEALFAHDFEV